MPTRYEDQDARSSLSAELRKLAAEDVGATMMFIVGKPSFLNRDDPMPECVSVPPMRSGPMIRLQ
ncbi:MAG: hypothetical protein AB7U61_11535 [Methylocystis sp.]